MAIERGYLDVAIRRGFGYLCSMLPVLLMELMGARGCHWLYLLGSGSTVFASRQMWPPADEHVPPSTAAFSIKGCSCGQFPCQEGIYGTVRRLQKKHREAVMTVATRSEQ